MKNAMKKSLAAMLVFAMIFSLSACSSKTEMTEENIVNAVDVVEDALRNFDVDKLEKYVDSQTLDYILKFAESHEQFVELGKAIFANLEMEVQSVDTENQTVTLTVRNKKLDRTASKFSQNLKGQYSSMQLLNMLSDEDFLDSSLGELVEMIQSATLTKEATVTLKVEQGKKNLVLSFDVDSEDAVSGGALQAIKKIFA